MKRKLALLVTVIGSITITSSVYASETVAKPMIKDERPIQIRSIQPQDKLLQTGIAAPGTNLNKITIQARSARKIMDMPIYNRQGNEIGEIEDIKFDTSSGKIQYVTIKKHNSKETKDQAGIAVPLEVLRVEKDRVVLIVDQSKLNGVPRPGNPETDESFQRDLHSHYGIAYPWEVEGQNLKKMVEKKRADLLKDDLQSDIGVSKKQKRDDPQPMNEDEMKLRAEFRKLLLIFNPL